MNKEKLQEVKASIMIFMVKFLIFTVVLVVVLDSYLPSRQDLHASIQQVLTERTKLYLLGIVQNPAVLYMTSELAERNGFLDSAKRDMELAVGLVELHSADKRAAKRYYDRLEMLNAKKTK